MSDEVILYHTDTCPICKMIEILLKQNNIEYVSNKDIEEMSRLGINHPPVLSVNGEFKVGQSIRDYINSRRG